MRYDENMRNVHTVQSFFKPDIVIGYLCKSNRDTLNGFKEGSEMIKQLLQKDNSGYNVENKLKKYKTGGKDINYKDLY